MTIDMHCHLDLYLDPDKIADRCVEEQVYVLSVTTTPKAWLGTSKLERPNGKIRTALGLHPQLAHLRYQELDLFDSFIGSTRYVGEIGLDGSKEFKPFLEQQLLVFRHILNSAQKSGGKILSIHSRAAANLILDELEKYPFAGTPIFHWFSGSQKELKRAIDMGAWFSVGPSMIKSKKGYEISTMIPKSRLVSETDGPFGVLEGQPLMPWQADNILPHMATIWKTDIKEAKAIIHNNFRNLILEENV